MPNLVLLFESLSRLKEVLHLLRVALAASADSCVGVLVAESLQPDSVLPLRSSPNFPSLSILPRDYRQGPHSRLNWWFSCWPPTAITRKEAKTAESGSYPTQFDLGQWRLVDLLRWCSETINILIILSLWNQVSLCSPGRLRTHYVHQADPQTLPFAGIRGVGTTSAGGKILGILHVSQALYQLSYISRRIS